MPRRDGQRALSGRATWTIAIVSIVCRAMLSTIVALLLWSIIPALAGFQTTTVMSGSMAPRLQVGDAVVVRHVDASQLSQGQVLLFDDPDVGGRLRMHRLLQVREDGQLVTRGDANADEDSSTIDVDAVHGAGFLRIPYAGLPNYWMRTGQTGPLVASVIVVIVLMCGVRLGRRLEDADGRKRRRHRGIRHPGLHRATAAVVAVLALSGAAVLPLPEAHAAYSAKSANGPNSWTTMCGDVTPTNLGASPLLYWGYGTGSGRDVTDLSGNGDTGTAPSSSDVVSADCSNGNSPSVQLGASSRGVVVEKTAHGFPGAMTVATWFKTSNPGGVPNPGGVLADFGDSGGTSPSNAANIDRVLFMRGDGNISFAANTLTVLGLNGSPMFCTTAKAGPYGYADGAWHLAVATYSNTAGCTLTIDAETPVVKTAAGLNLSLLSGYQGYWRFGFDAVSSSNGWTGATTRQYFQGSLDESQVYNAIVDPAAILARRH